MTRALLLLFAAACGQETAPNVSIALEPETGTCHYCSGITLGCEMKVPPTCGCWDEPGPCHGGGIDDAGVRYCLGEFSNPCKDGGL